jgi:hypothetical protein
MTSFPHTLKNQAEAALDDTRFDFIATYHAVADLRRLARTNPEILDGQTIGAIERLLQGQAFREVRQAYFLFREAASVMTDMAIAPEGNGLGKKALSSLKRLLQKDDVGSAHRGVAEALGSLPVHISGPAPEVMAAAVPHYILEQLLSENRLKTISAPRGISAGAWWSRRTEKTACWSSNWPGKRIRQRGCKKKSAGWKH